MRLLRILFVLAALAAVPCAARAQQPPAPRPPADFVPVENAPPGEQIPAMPLLGAAYGLIWVGVFGYVWSLTRRMRKVEAEIAQLESQRR